MNTPPVDMTNLYYLRINEFSSERNSKNLIKSQVFTLYILAMISYGNKNKIIQKRINFSKGTLLILRRILNISEYDEDGTVLLLIPSVIESYLLS
jgi:hypothetical protein